MYSCMKCGLCCKNLGHNDLYKSIRNAEGACIYFDQHTNLCSIYEDRPLICRIDEFYDLVGFDGKTREEYYRLNELDCIKMQESVGLFGLMSSNPQRG